MELEVEQLVGLIREVKVCVGQGSIVGELIINKAGGNVQLHEEDGVGGEGRAGEENLGLVVEENHVHGQLQPLSHVQPPFHLVGKQLLGLGRQQAYIKTGNSGKRVASNLPLVQQAI